jgi:hypothetical protein
MFPGEWNSRRQNLSPPARTVSTHAGGFCSCRRGFNRRILYSPANGIRGDRIEVRLRGLPQPTQVGFVPVDAVLTAG